MDICHRLDPDCRSCGKPIYWKRRIFFLNKLWHLECFKCSRCKVKLNTDVDADDKKYSKAHLGEDLALRCSKCNEIFQRKKFAKLAFKKLDLLNFYEHEIVKENKVNQFNLNYSTNHLNRTNCEHNHKPHSTYKREDHNLNDLKNFIHNHKCIDHCKLHKYLKDKNYHPNSKDTSKSNDSSEIYRSLFKEKADLKERKQSHCTCTGCKMHMKNLKDQLSHDYLR